ncbi:MAG: GAF domain-containing protein [Gammaproteobacteria bacterium]|nr:GAF domain-containing protein [Gammaproteobacteria bacterium]MDH5630341.1 GAF domain-containing protein [Gammaproteobacteria bacterium]
MSDTFYRDLNQQLKGLLTGETNWVTNLSQTSALLNQYLENINWVGFYLTQKDGNLLLGPFHGKPACVHIESGKGVCGTAAASREIQVVGDVHQFPGHIACDAASESEIVLPIIVDDKVVGVLDIDSPVLSRFNQDDAKGLQAIVETLIAATEWPSI